MPALLGTVKEWLERHPRVRRPFEAVILVLFALAVASQTPRLFDVGSRDYSVAHDTVLLASVAALLLALLIKPKAMWRHLAAGVRSLASGKVPGADQGLAGLVAVLVVAVSLVLSLSLDWTAIQMSRGISAVIAVNVAIIAKQMWAKYGRSNTESSGDDSR